MQKAGRNDIITQSAVFVHMSFRMWAISLLNGINTWLCVCWTKCVCDSPLHKTHEFLCRLVHRAQCRKPTAMCCSDTREFNVARCGIDGNKLNTLCRKRLFCLCTSSQWPPGRRARWVFRILGVPVFKSFCRHDAKRAWISYICCVVDVYTYVGYECALANGCACASWNALKKPLPYDMACYAAIKGMRCRRNLSTRSRPARRPKRIASGCTYIHICFFVFVYHKYHVHVPAWASYLLGFNLCVASIGSASAFRWYWSTNTKEIKVLQGRRCACRFRVCVFVFFFVAANAF